MIFPVRITKTARRDLKEIHAWIAEHDSISRADYVLDRLALAVESIATLPERGSRPHELWPGMGTDCRQVFFKPYRLIYLVRPTVVVVILIADGRRNLQSILLGRLTEN